MGNGFFSFSYLENRDKSGKSLGSPIDPVVNQDISAQEVLLLYTGSEAVYLLTE